VIQEIQEKKTALQRIEWTLENYAFHLNALSLFPSVAFGVESALLSLLEPKCGGRVEISALLYGSCEQILHQAELKKKEGYKSAKVKVSNLSLDEAFFVLTKLHKDFFLRVDVNRAWSYEESLSVFSSFPKNAFEYIEEPCRDLEKLPLFPFPLAIDESFPRELSLEDLKNLPQLQALIYKPTLQGGLCFCLPLYHWTKAQGIELILSSCFETDLGLYHIAKLSQRLSLKTPLGIGTYEALKRTTIEPPLSFTPPFLVWP
jgi:o-succinylbenzoate synthase